MPGELMEDLQNPYLFSERPAGAYEYGKNDYGGLTASGSLYLADNPARDSAAQAAAGGEMRRGSDSEWGPDDGGHLIGARFGGSAGPENLTAQNRNLNRGDYKIMENRWADHLESGDKVFVYMETDQAQRPEVYMGYAIYENPEGVRDFEYFHMVNESRSEIAAWEAEAEALMAEDYLGSAAMPEANEYLGSAGQEEASPGSEASIGGMSM